MKPLSTALFRRRFITTSALAATGWLLQAVPLSGRSPGAEEGEIDSELAAVVKDYGQTRRIRSDGYARVGKGMRRRRVPVCRMDIAVQDRDAFLRAFERFTHLSDRVSVAGNTVRLVRADRLYVLEHRVA